MDPITIAAFAKPAARIVNNLLKPVYAKIEKDLSTKAQLAYHRLVGSYSDYLNSAVERHSYFSSVVFKNEQRKLVDYYQPLTLIQSRTQQNVLIDGYPKKEIDEVQKVLIVDTAGMGKTTLLKSLFLNCVHEEAGIPIFVELRKLSKKKTLLSFILEQLSDVEGNVGREVFFKLLSSGEFVFFLDGYDEIPEIERSEVTSAIQQFIQKTPGNKFLLTSRDEDGLVAFPQFQRYTIRPLEKEEAFELLRKYSAESPLAEQLIDKLELPENRAIHEFLANPLLASLLFKSFEYKHTVPLKKHIFYRQVYEALYETHDLTKEGGEFQRPKRSGLDIDRFAKVLRCFGALTYKAGKVELGKDEALEFIESAKKLAIEPKISSSNFLHDITHAVPLLIIEGNYIRWTHRSIQEYFAAQYICTTPMQKRIEILLKHYNDANFGAHTNLISLCADIDKSSFDQSIGSAMAKELLLEFEESYLELRGKIDEALLSERKELTTGKFAFFVRLPKSKDFSDLDAARREHMDLHNRMRKVAGEYATTRITHCSPSVGFTFCKLGQCVSTIGLRLGVPFIINNEPSFHFSGDPFEKTVDFLQISDGVENVLNRIDQFENINTLIRSFSDWRFDADAARNYLIEVNDELSAKEDAEPW